MKDPYIVNRNCENKIKAVYIDPSDPSFKLSMNEITIERKNTIEKQRKKFEEQKEKVLKERNKNV